MAPPPSAGPIGRPKRPGKFGPRGTWQKAVDTLWLCQNSY